MGPFYVSFFLPYSCSGREPAQADAVFLSDPFREKADQPDPQAWLICNIIKIFPLIYSGCGSLHLLRALDGTRILQAAAPTAPSCFCRWQRSSLLQSERGGHFKSFTGSGSQTPGRARRSAHRPRQWKGRSWHLPPRPSAAPCWCPRHGPQCQCQRLWRWGR